MHQMCNVYFKVLESVGTQFQCVQEEARGLGVQSLCLSGFVGAVYAGSY